jgi:hypothetical protein
LESFGLLTAKLITNRFAIMAYINRTEAGPCLLSEVCPRADNDKVAFPEFLANFEKTLAYGAVV